MEKQAVEGRDPQDPGLLSSPAGARGAARSVPALSLFRSGFYLFALASAILLWAAPLAAQSPAASGAPLRGSVDAAPAVLAPGDRCVVTVLVDWPEPRDLNVERPSFPAGAVLLSSRTEPRSVESDLGERRRWTAVSWELRFDVAGVYRLGPFVARAAGRSASFGPVELVVAVPGDDPRRGLSWEGAPLRARVGVPFTASLAAVGFAPRGEARLAVPENALFEPLALTKEESAKGLVAKYRVTPLEAGIFSMPAVLVDSVPGTDLSGKNAPSRPVASSPLSVQVDPAPGNPGTVQSSGAKPRKASVRPLPSVLPAVFPYPEYLRRAEAGRLAAAASAWSKGDRVGALAVLRAGERRDFLGFVLEPTRAAAEASLGLPPGPSEPFASAGLFACCVFVLAGSCAFLLWTRRKKPPLPGRFGPALDEKALSGVTSAPRRSLLCGSALAAAVLAVLLGAWAAYGVFLAPEGAVLDACVAYRVPDSASARSASFEAGQGVVLRSRTAAWVYAEAPDGREGWLEAKKARTY